MHARRWPLYAPIDGWNLSPYQRGKGHAGESESVRLEAGSPFTPVVEETAPMADGAAQSTGTRPHGTTLRLRSLSGTKCLRYDRSDPVLFTARHMFSTWEFTWPVTKGTN